jgi:type VI secretion system protein ImpJ
VKRPGALEISEENSTEMARYKFLVGEVQDNSGPARTASQVHLGRLQLALTTSDDQSGNFVKIAVARIIELKADGMVVLDDQFIPSCLNCSASPRLHGFLTEILGLLNHRGEALAGRVTHAGGGGVSEIADYLLLQVVNRYEPLFNHLAQTALIHPEAFYSLALQFAGELGTFTSENHRAASFPVYDHDRPQECMTAAMNEIRRSLSMVLSQTAIELPLEERRYGIRVATITDKGLVSAANLVLAVSADVPSEVLASQFPRQVKIGAVEKIADLVNLQLPGVTVRQLPVAPRQIPYHAGCSYFELDKKSEHWTQLTNSAGIAVHAGSEFPGIDVHLWAIRE